MIQETPYIHKQLNQLEEIYTVCRIKNITLSKTTAAQIVGSRYLLEKLVALKKIRMTKPNKLPNGKWFCMAEDVLRYANYKTQQKNYSL